MARIRKVNYSRKTNDLVSIPSLDFVFEGKIFFINHITRVNVKVQSFLLIKIVVWRFFYPSDAGGRPFMLYGCLLLLVKISRVNLRMVATVFFSRRPIIR